MKTTITILIIIAIIISLRFIWGYFASRVERPDMNTIKTIGDIQIRTLPAQIHATVTVSGNETQAPHQAFGILAGFIFGNNTSRSSVVMTAPVISQQISQPIAMTAPVISQQVNTSIYEVSFLMPKEYTMQTLPIPNDKRIHIHQVNPKTIAVVSFARYATESNITTYRNKLLDGLKKAGISTTGNSYVAQYNDPRTPPTMRTNEIWIEIIS